MNQSYVAVISKNDDGTYMINFKNFVNLIKLVKDENEIGKTAYKILVERVKKYESEERRLPLPTPIEEIEAKLDENQYAISVDPFKPFEETSFRTFEKTVLLDQESIETKIEEIEENEEIEEIEENEKLRA